MNHEQWHAEADRLKKCLELSTEWRDSLDFREQLSKHLHTQPVWPTTGEAKNVTFVPTDYYANAFYAMVEEMGVGGARNDTPENVYRSVVLPTLRGVVADSKRLQELEELVRKNPRDGVHLTYAKGDGFGMSTDMVGFTGRSSLRQLLDRVSQESKL